MIKPFGKHIASVRARRNNDVSSDSAGVSRTTMVRYRTRKKKRLLTVVTVAIAAVMVPIMIVSAASGDMSMKAPESVAQVQQAEPQAAPAPTPTPTPTPTPELTEKTVAAPAVAEDTSSVTAEGESAPAPTPEPTPAPPVYVNLTEGMKDPSIHALQQRLMDLYYMGMDETTDYYGPQTNQAVQYFQRKHGLTVDGAAGPETQALLFSDQAKEYTMALGADGADVLRMQERLVELGYPISAPTGHFGEETQKAVQYFQRMNSLTDDGSVGHKTEELIYSSEAEKSSEYEAMKKAEADKKAAEEAAAAKPAEKPSKPSKPEEKPSKPSKPTEKPSKPEESAPSYEADPGSVEAFISVAQAQLGKPYVLGGKGPNSFDCSGLIYYALRESGNDVGYMTSGGWRNSGYTTISNVDDMQRGDIICMNGHVAIYLGGGRVLDASSSQNAMVERDFGSWFQNGFILAKRPL
ncbi:MAG: peptidoglycan-binding protein [Christensenella sp.]